MDFENIKLFLAKKMFGLKNRIAMYERLADFFESKIPVFEALGTIKRRYEEANDPRSAMLADWMNRMRSGGTFSDALSDWVPANELILIVAGEQGLGPETGLRAAVKAGEAIAEIKNTVIFGAAEPIAMLAMCAGMLGAYSTHVTPVFLTMLPLERWPESAQALQAISTFIASYWYIVLGIAGSIVTAVGLSLGHWTGSVRDFLDKFPPYSVYKTFQASAFLLALSAMMQSGIAFNDSLKMINSRAAPWLSNHIQLMMKKLRHSGSDHGSSLDTGMLEKEVAGDIRDYSQLASFEVAIQKIGEKTLSESVKSIKAKMSVVKYLMMGLVAGIILWMYATGYMLQTIVAEEAGKPKQSIGSKK